MLAHKGNIQFGLGIKFPTGNYNSQDVSVTAALRTSRILARWRYPSLSIHGIEGAFSQPGAKTVIPAKVIGKFSIRTVPNMEIDAVNDLVYSHVKTQFAKLNSKNSLNVYCQHAGKWWVASPKHWNFSAAAKAVERVWGVAPDLTREGGRQVSHRPALFHLILELSFATTPLTTQTVFP